MQAPHRQSLLTFFSKHPALIWGLYTVLGTGYGLTGANSYLLIAAGLLSIQVLIKQKSALSLTLFALAFLYTNHAHTIPSSSISETATFSISSIHKSKSRFSKRLYYRGTLLNSPSAKNLPVLIFSNEKLTGNANYKAKGDLSKTNNGGWLFKLSNEAKSISSAFPIALYRFHLKEKMSNWIHTHYPNPRVEIFLSGLVTGEFRDPELSWTFSRFGLQHIMAISGFHFSLVALMMSSLLQLIFPRKLTASLVLIGLSTYFVFLGPTASILRAWVMILIFFSGQLLEKKGQALNSLGIALIVLSFYDPFLTLSIGFTFSFLITASILLFYPLITDFFEKKSLTELLSFDRLDQHIYIFHSWLRNGFALTLAVHLAALPLVLFYFQKFPLLSLFYNLFFPFFVAISLFLFFLSFILWPLTPLLCTINTYWTKAILGLTFNLPTAFDVYMRSPEIPSSVLVFYFLILFSTGAVLSIERAPKRKLRLA